MAFSRPLVKLHMRTPSCRSKFRNSWICLAFQSTHRFFSILLNPNRVRKLLSSHSLTPSIIFMIHVHEIISIQPSILTVAPLLRIQKANLKNSVTSTRVPIAGVGHTELCGFEHKMYHVLRPAAGTASPVPRKDFSAWSRSLCYSASRTRSDLHLYCLKKI